MTRACGVSILMALLLPCASRAQQHAHDNSSTTDGNGFRLSVHGLCDGTFDDLRRTFGTRMPASVSLFLQLAPAQHRAQ